MSIKQGEPYLEKLAKLTPVYIIGFFTIIEVPMSMLRTRPVEEQMLTIAAVMIIGLLVVLAVEVGNRKLHNERKAQLGATIVSTLLYMLLAIARMLNIDLINMPFGILLLICSGGWTVFAPILVDYAPHWRIHV